MLRGLFINNKKARDSIYESGYMVYRCLISSEIFSLDYCEVDHAEREIKTGYDFYLFNYHPVTMAWLDTARLKKELGFIGTIILEVAPGDPFVFCSSKDFSFYCVLDPTIKPLQKNLYAFPRPLEDFDLLAHVPSPRIPVIGSFGFATKGKGFQHVVEAVNKEFNKALIRINIPYGDFVPDSGAYAEYLAGLCTTIAKPGIEVVVTHDFMEKKELIEWCANNTLNCFLYDRNLPGLAATTDQAIASGKPLAVSNNDTFRHITAYLKPYPQFSLRDSIEKSPALVQKMKQDWSQHQFLAKFEGILKENNFTKRQSSSFNYLLPLKKVTFRDSFNRKYKKYKRRLSKLRFTTLFNSKNVNEVI